VFRPRGHIIATALIVLTACGGPVFFIPGGELSGETVTEPVTDWSFVTFRFADLETFPDAPYSVKVNYIVRGGVLYVDPSEGRRWLDNIRSDPRVRVRFGSRVYPLKAVLVGRPGELEGFPEASFIYRLDPRGGESQRRP